MPNFVHWPPVAPLTQFWLPTMRDRDPMLRASLEDAADMLEHGVRRPRGVA